MDFLKIKKSQENVYTSEDLWSPLPGFSVYGGQLVGQALLSAIESISDDSHPHSLHAYFLRAGSTHSEINYIVSGLRDGRTTKTRRVEANQNSRLIFTMDVSFSSNDISSSDSHMYSNPRILVEEAEFEDLTTFVYNSLSKTHKKHLKADFDKIMSHLNLLNEHFEIKVSKTMNHKKIIKIKLKEKLEKKQNITCVLAFISDFFLLEVSLHPFDESVFSQNISLITSVDHNMYFHSYDYPEDGEYVYVVECIRVSNSRPLCVGYIMDNKNNHLITAVQEGIVRFKEKEE